MRLKKQLDCALLGLLFMYVCPQVLSAQSSGTETDTAHLFAADVYCLTTDSVLKPIEVQGFAGDSIHWYGSDMMPIPEASGLTRYIPDSNYFSGADVFLPASYMFYIVQETNDVPTDTAVVHYTIMDCPASILAAQSAVYCENDSARHFLYSLVGHHQTVLWFSSFDDYLNKNILEQGSVLNVTDSIDAGVDTFYVASLYQYNGIQCYSPCSTATLTVLDVPVSHITMPDTFCSYGDSVPIEVFPPYIPQTDSVWGTANTVKNGFFFPNIADSDHLYFIYCTRTYSYEIEEQMYSCSYTAKKQVAVHHVPRLSVPDTVFFAVIENDTEQVMPHLFVENIEENACVQWLDAEGVLLSDSDCDSSYMPNVSAEGEYVYHAIQAVNGCESEPVDVYLEVSLCPIGKPVVGDYASEICTGDVLVLDAMVGNYYISAPKPDGNEEIQWFDMINDTLEPVFEGASFAPDIKDSQAQYIYSVRVYDPDLECASALQLVRFTVWDNTMPIILVDDTVCVSGENDFEIRSDAKEMVHWIVDSVEYADVSANVLIDASGKDQVQVQAYKYSSLSQCYSDTVLKSITIRALPDMFFELKRSSSGYVIKNGICQGEDPLTILFNSLGDNYDLMFSPSVIGNMLEQDAEGDVFRYYTDVEGNDTIQFSASDGYCSDTVAITLHVIPPPELHLSVSQRFDDGVADIEAYAIQDTVAGIVFSQTFYSVDFGDGSTEIFFEDPLTDTPSMVYPISHDYSKGEYTVSLIATNSYGCKDSLHAVIRIQSATAVETIDSKSPVDIYTVDGKLLMKEVAFDRIHQNIGEGVYVLRQTRKGISVCSIFYVQ